MSVLLLSCFLLFQVMHLVDWLAVLEQAHVRILKFWPLLLCATLLHAGDFDVGNPLAWQAAHIVLTLAIVVESGTCYTRIREVPMEFKGVTNCQMFLFCVITAFKLGYAGVLAVHSYQDDMHFACMCYGLIMTHTLLVCFIFGFVYPSMHTNELYKFRRCRRFLELLDIKGLEADQYAK